MSARRRVLIVIGQLEVGGTERHLLNTIPQVLCDSLEIYIYSMRSGGKLEPELVAAGLRVLSPAHHSRRWIGLLKTSIHLIRTLRQLRPDIVHYFLPEAYLLGGICALFSPPSVRIMSRRSLNTYQKKWPLARFIEQCLHRRTNAILANSNAVLRDLLNEGVHPDRCAVIYNGVDVPTTSTAKDLTLRETLGIGQEVVVFVMVANLIPYKGHADVIEAFRIAQTNSTVATALLLIGADSGIESELRRQVHTARLDPAVYWLGVRADVAACLNASDIALLGSHEEGFSNAVLEAMAHGLATIVTDVGGNRESVSDGVTGIVVPPRDPRAMARAMSRLLTDPITRSLMGRGGRERVSAKFHTALCSGAYRRLYLTISSDTHESITDLIGAHLSDLSELG
ncbi:MAG: glycosyltransferase [Proteobacteria bacterium]|nr:glycosyltransferase [Pseudomonadota bacterium]